MKTKVRKEIRSHSFLASICLCSIALLFGGCSENTTVPVSGTVTLDGKPLVGVEIVFGPVATKENSSPGPYSYAVTDEEGKYQLKTRHGKPGVIVGDHDVTFEFPDLEDPEELIAELEDARAEKEDTSEILVRIAEQKKLLKEQPKIPRSAKQRLTVPADGIDPCDFALVSD